MEWEKCVDAPSRKVLIVERDEATRERLAQALRDAGFRVDAFAQEAPQSESYDIALIEVSCRAEGGSALLRRLAGPGGITLCVSLLDSGDHARATEGYLLGAHGLLWKPLDPSTLAGFVRDLDRSRRVLLGSSPAALAKKPGWRVHAERVRALWGRIPAARKCDLKVAAGLAVSMLLTIPLIQGASACTSGLRASGETTIAMLDRAGSHLDRLRQEGDPERLDEILDRAEAYLDKGAARGEGASTNCEEDRLAEILERADSYLDKLESSSAGTGGSGGPSTSSVADLSPTR